MRLNRQRRGLIKAVCLILWVIMVLAYKGCLSSNSEDSLPNIIVFVADDMGWKDCSYTGLSSIETPNIDALANEGMNFANAHLTIAQCSPSRISILSGRYPHNTGSEDLHVPLEDSVPILPDFLSEAGYFTGMLRKSHLGDEGTRRFNWYDRKLDAIDEFLTSAGQQPFFLWVGFTDPHRPYQDIDEQFLVDPSSVTVPPYLVDDERTREDIADYLAYCRRLDHHLGELRAAIERAGEGQNAIFIFLSDNGAPFPMAKGTVYDEGIRTPLIFAGPGVRNDTYSHLVSTIDLAPTILSLAGIDAPAAMKGADLSGILERDEEPLREMVFMERNWHNTDEHIRAVRTETHKLVHNAYTDRPAGVASDIGRGGSWKSLMAAESEGSLRTGQDRLFTSPRPEYELYDLVNDPDEFVNLWDDPAYRDVRTDLLDKLENWKTETYDYSPDQRRRPDNVDRYSGSKIDQRKVPPFIRPVPARAFILRQPHPLDTADIKRISGPYLELTSYNVPPDFPPHGFWLKFEGPTWENDHIGYRFSSDTRHRFDIFGKRTTDLVLDTVGLDYHEIQPWGSDILKVGNTFGIGSPAIAIDDSIYFWDTWENKTVRTANLSDRSLAIAEFTGLKAGGHVFDLIQTLTIYPGNPFTQSTIEVTPAPGGNPDFSIVTGIVQHAAAERGEVPGTDLSGFYTYGLQSYHDEGLGMAVVTWPEHEPVFGEAYNSYIMTMQPVDNRVDYYFMADWARGVYGSRDEATFTKQLGKYTAAIGGLTNIDGVQ